MNVADRLHPPQRRASSTCVGFHAPPNSIELRLCHPSSAPLIRFRWPAPFTNRACLLLPNSTRLQLASAQQPARRVLCSATCPVCSAAAAPRQAKPEIHAPTTSQSGSCAARRARALNLDVQNGREWSRMVLVEYGLRSQQLPARNRDGGYHTPRPPTSISPCGFALSSASHPAWVSLDCFKALVFRLPVDLCYNREGR